MSTPCAADDFDHEDTRLVVVFADMAGFTTYTETYGDHQAAQLATSFAGIATSVLGPSDEVIKTLGDAVMVTSGSASAATEYLRRLRGATARIPGFPLLRAAMSEGQLVKRGGDVFGATVNTAARLVAAAGPGQVIADRAAISGVGNVEDIALTPLGFLPLRNIDSPVEAFLVELDPR
ncbi:MULTISPECIES: adenylate/guanylate cyclase domain-containing protein [Mycolicibacterium]|uniref:Guanylate cyclase domain-containing protein n=1 Tax=Mycolicibacterium bacteremicum TaxID=564198 RepID=A0A1W9Z3K9_MYCBA|nr:MULTISPECIES: adenylate/guanylate cyclase domain-containing protein [Mycolicibacterium]MCV7432666.1 adenylate/guanylate cyclase domain-containing protein [Mycolicibacterium bacteremicum]ORA06911.1 hypothetical protein BST17_00040 [Mycolicibacterium bacteremicum]QVI28300.1 adenylate/guanylate cyclase domain-containing protein [Mycolicibacterium neoaurum]